MSWRARRMSAAICTKLSATMSTPSARPKRRSSRVLRGEPRGGQRHPGALMPLCSPSCAAVDHRRLDLRAVGRDRPAARRGRRRAAARRPAARCAPAARRSWRPGPARPTSSPVAIISGSPGCSGIGRPPASRPVRIFGPAQVLQDRDVRARPRAAASRTRVKLAACVSCVPCEKFRRKTSTPAAIERVERRRACRRPGRASR